MIPAHVPLTLAREVKTERAAGSSVEDIARTLAFWLGALSQPAACLACLSRRRRGLPLPCGPCAAVTPPSGLFRWREPPEARHGDDTGLLAACEPSVAARSAPDTGARSDRPHGDHQAAVVADVDAAPAVPPLLPGHDDVDDWEYGAWWPQGAFDGQLVVGG